MSTPSVVEDIFLAALDKGTPEQRAAYLDEACRGDAELRRRVERLLHAHPKAGSFLEQPAVQREATGAYTPDPNAPLSPASQQPGGIPSSDAVGTHIGPYKLLQQLGEGGMGTVYVAEQEHPVKRRVALKVIKAGMDSAQVLQIGRAHV